MHSGEGNVSSVLARGSQVPTGDRVHFVMHGNEYVLMLSHRTCIGQYRKEGAGGFRLFFYMRKS